MLIFFFNRGVVPHELILAAIQALDDGLDVGLSRLILSEVVAYLIAKWYAIEKSSTPAQILRRIEHLNLLAEGKQRAGNLGSLGERTFFQGHSRSVEKATRGGGRAPNLLAPHVTDRLDLTLELRRLSLEIDNRVDKFVDHI